MKIYNKDIDTKEEMLALLAEGLSGTCMSSPAQEMEHDAYVEAVKFFGITEEDVEQYCIDHEIFECEGCGWWVYEGEGDGTYCDDCQDDHAEHEENY